MNYSEKEDFSLFGKTFQENMCQLILYDRQYADQMKEILNINFLELTYLRVFIKKIFEYKDKYGVHPSANIMTTILRTELESENELAKKQVRDFFARMMKTQVQDTDFIKATSIDFCRKQVLKEAIIKSVPLLKNSSFEKVQKLINDAMLLGATNDCGYDYIKDFEQRFLIKARNPVSTGWDIIDRCMKGGHGRGEIGVVIAPTGAGKSMALVHLGAEAIKAGNTVIHITLELLDTATAVRYDSCLTGYPLQNIADYKDEIFEHIQTLDGGLIVKEYPTKSASTSTIKSYLNKLKNSGVDIDMIIVDYADLLRATKTSGEKRHDLESIYEELRGIAQEFECPLWTASQTNRTGLNADVVTMESISEAFNKCFVADFIVSLARTKEDKQANTGRLYIAKNRNGPYGLVYDVFMDTSKVKIKVLPQSTSVQGAKASIAKKQENSLKEKYKNFRKQKGN